MMRLTRAPPSSPRTRTRIRLWLAGRCDEGHGLPLWANRLPIPIPPSSSPFSTSAIVKSHPDFTHAIIGGGVVGLAIARKLASRASTVLIERHEAAGMETSSRNSEVIHAGLYYSPDSLKTKLCIDGREMLYEYCRKRSVGHRRTRKWIVAQTAEEWEECLKIHHFARSVDVPTRFVGVDEGRRREPDVRAKAGILESESTGIVDSHGLMACLQADFEESDGDCIFQSEVLRVDCLRGDDDGRCRAYRIFARDRASGEQNSITAETIINSAGLNAVTVNNMILPSSRHRRAYYAKGTYFSYAASSPKPSTLIYPAPTPGLAGLGTHLTIDLQGRVRFGPDVEWVLDPTDLTPQPHRLQTALPEIRRYLPSVHPRALSPDYCGIRPKLSNVVSAVFSNVRDHHHHHNNTKNRMSFQDFIIQIEPGYQGFVNLLGIESPGLTSCLAIADHVHDLLYR